MSRNSFPPKHTTIITFRLKTGQPPLSFEGLLHSGVIKEAVLYMRSMHINLDDHC